MACRSVFGGCSRFGSTLQILVNRFAIDHCVFKGSHSVHVRWSSSGCWISNSYRVGKKLHAVMSRNILPSQVKKGAVEVPMIMSLGVSPSCAHSTSTGDFPKKFSEEELKNRLTPMQYRVTQRSGTERAFTGEYWDNHQKGIYKCVVCEEDLFDSDTKFESGSGWPSFYDVLEKGKVKLIKDASLGMVRTEVVCAQCGAHLGHVFDDGPAPTGQRYCMNSASLKFNEKKEDL